MAIFEQTLTNFSNGISQNSKNWLPDSGRFMRNLAIFEDSDSVTLTPKPIKDDGGIVTDLVKVIVDANPYENARYALGDSGKIYKIVNNVWTLDHTITTGSPTGQGLIMLADGLYYATSTTIGRKYPLSTGSGTYNDDFFSDGTHNLDATVALSGNTYQPPLAITETAANKITYTPAYDPLVSVQVYVTARGTGNWTVTVHDALNNVVGTSTSTNSALTNGQMNTFTLTTPGRITIANQYHIHVTSTVADGTLQTGTASDLSTAQYNTYFGILIADTQYHPMIQHTNGTTGTIEIGNEHYIAQYDGLTYNPNKITLEPGFKVRTQAKVNENTYHYCWKTNNIDAFEYGRAYVWDGIQVYFNYSRDLTNGMPNAVINFKNRPFGIFGSDGNIEMAPDESSPFRLLQNAPKLTVGARVEVKPNAIGVWQNRVLFGYGNTNDTAAGQYNVSSPNPPPLGLEPGVYEFGNQSDRAITYTQVSTEVLNFPFQPSQTIVNPTNFDVGCVEPFGKDCYVSYRDGSTYYVDRITKGNAPASFGSFESLIVDQGFLGKNLAQMPYRTKLGVSVRVTFKALATGCTVVAKYRKDGATNWTFGTAAVAGDTSCVVNLGTLGGERFKELEYGFDVTATVNYPTITSITLFYDPLPQEADNTQL